MKTVLSTVLVEVAFFFCMASAYGQNNLTDSINRILRAHLEDTSKVVKLNSLSGNFFNKGNYDLALQYGRDALVLSQKLKFKKGEADAFEKIGLGHAGGNNFDEARKVFRLALIVNEELNNKKNIAGNLHFVAMTFGMEENYPEAFKYFYDALKRWETLGDKKNIALCLTDIAFCYYEQGNTEECLKHISRALDLYQKINDKDGLARAYNFMATLYLNQGNYTEALKKDSAVLKIYNDLGNDVETFYVFQNMGNIEEKKGEIATGKGESLAGSTLYRQAWTNYNKALSSSLRGDQSILIAEAYANLGRINIKLKNFDESRTSLMKSLQLSDDNKGNLSDVYNSLSTLDSAQGNYRGAYKYYKLFIQYRDSISNEKNLRNSTQTRLQYEFDKKEAISKTNQDKKNIEAKRVRNLQYSALGAVLLIAGFLFRSNRQKQRAKTHIEKAYVQLESAQAQLIQSEKMASLGELTAGIAHEIQNPLNFVNNFSEVNKELLIELKEEIAKGNVDEVKALASDITENEEKINHHGKRADAIVKSMLQHSRSSHGVKEPTDMNALADEYLKLAYHGLRAKDISFSATTRTNYDKTIGSINIIPQDIGRVILNLITNAFYAVTEKKKQISGDYEPNVSISTKRAENKIEITVADNGSGIPRKVLDKIFQPFFTTKPTGQGTGLGLSLSYDIIKAHGGEIKIETGEGEGSKFIIHLPT